MDQGVLGTSVDPGGRYVVTIDPMTGVEHASEYTIVGPPWCQCRRSAG